MFLMRIQLFLGSHEMNLALKRGTVYDHCDALLILVWFCEKAVRWCDLTCVVRTHDWCDSYHSFCSAALRMHENAVVIKLLNLSV